MEPIMGIDEVLKLVESLQDTDVQEVEIADGDRKIRIVRMTPGTPANSAPVSVDNPLSLASPPPKESVSSENGTAENNYIEVKSPMVGTFYRSPEPDAEPFVKEQDRISTGQQLCIIEAMKLMNPIQAEMNGQVMAILVEDAQPVEYGQPLFLIEPA